MNNLIRDFFGKTDLFLETQFSAALGLIEGDAVHLGHSELISFTKSISFDEPHFEQARQGWLNILEGSSVILGFPELRDIPKGSKITEHLEKARKNIDAGSFLKELKTYSHVKFDTKGLSLDVAPQDWFRTNDILLPFEVDPEGFKNQLLDLSGFKNPLSKYLFKRSHANFFMMSLHLKPLFCIGHGSLNTVFNLSTFSHEIGHTTTLREPDLEKLFLEYPNSVIGSFEVSNEDDSYLYELFFMNNIMALTKVFELNIEIDLVERLARRKAIQNNLHILKSIMNYNFFSEISLKEMSDLFLDLMKQIYPAYKPISEFDWLNYATLDQPLSRIGYLKAYPKTFGKNL